MKRYDKEVAQMVAEMLEAAGVQDEELAINIAVMVHDLYGRDELSVEVVNG